MAITYMYRCGDCDHRFETQQSIKDNPLSECPECHENKLVKIIQQGAFLLKVTDWYKQSH